MKRKAKKGQLRERQKLKERGITLIALVVTIIVLLILAGVTIATLFGDNGIITRANEAVQTNTEAEEKERIALAWQSAYMNKENANEEITAEELEEQLIADGATGVTAIGTGTITVTFTHPEGNNVYTVDQDGNIISRGANKWYTMAKEDRTVITDGETELYIGDYVAYDEQVGDLSYISTSERSGYSTADQIYNLNKNDVGWRVLGLDEETGEILLISDDIIYATDSTDGDTDQAYRLSGQVGYQYGIDELNNICKIFGNGEKATGARSITVEDVNKITGYNPEEESSTYGKKVTYYWNDSANNIYYEREDGLTGTLYNSHSSGFSWYDEESESWKFSANPGTISEKQKITTLTSTSYMYWAGNIHAYGTNSSQAAEGLSRSSEEYKTLFGVSTSYWLASSCIITGSNMYVNTGLRYMNIIGFIDQYPSDLYLSFGHTFTQTKAVRPVVSLRPDISIVGGDGSQGEGAYQIQ